MAVVEGYSNYIMNAVGRDLMPDYHHIARRFEQRQRQKSPAEQFFIKLTGLDMKMEQYRLGEAFINEVVSLRGDRFAHRVWEGPEMLPTMAELRDPHAWIARIESGASLEAGAATA
jgi:putative hydrolase